MYWYFILPNLNWNKDNFTANKVQMKNWIGVSVSPKPFTRLSSRKRISIVKQRNNFEINLREKKRS